MNTNDGMVLFFAVMGCAWVILGSAIVWVTRRDRNRREASDV